MLAQTVKISFYLPPPVLSQKEQERQEDLLTQHPKERKYLSFAEYKDGFSISEEEGEYLRELATRTGSKIEEHLLERKAVVYATANFIQTIATEKNIRLDHNLGEIHIDKAESAPVSKGYRGFVKQNVEQRGSYKTYQGQGHFVSEFAQAYNFPTGDGAGQTIGLIELGGDFNKVDIWMYFSGLNMEVPTIEVVGYPTKLTNAATTLKNNLEVTADIQVAGTLAPKAKLVLYYGETILEAVKSALSDSIHQPDVLSISWGGSELTTSAIELEELSQAFREAAFRGITVIAASGDHGAYNGLPIPNVMTPVNDPLVLGCGGTEDYLWGGYLTGNKAWTGSGGGYSRRKPTPKYQQKASNIYLSRHPQYLPFNPMNGRGVPDIAANASPNSGYKIVFNGQWMPMGGTSLSTPLWAALIARLNQALGYKLGFINELLYSLEGSPAFIQVTNGNNGLYLADYGWNPCTGLGEPNGKLLLQAIKDLEPKAEPKTPPKTKAKK
ncbi:MAG: S53 family peptidase [Aureispira sp.]